MPMQWHKTENKSQQLNQGEGYHEVLSARTPNQKAQNVQHSIAMLNVDDK